MATIRNIVLAWVLTLPAAPTVLTASVAYHPYFPGFIPVDTWKVGQAYLRAISNPITGRILKLQKTDS